MPDLKIAEAVKRNRNKNVVLTCINDREYTGILIQLDSDYVSVKTGKRGRPPRIYIDDITLINVIPDPDVAVKGTPPITRPQITRPINTAFEDLDEALIETEPEEGPSIDDLAECEILCDEALSEVLY